MILLLPLSSFALTTKQLAVSINLAGKQRMLSQKMSKEVLLIKAGIDKKENLKKLQQSRDLFHQTLSGLIKGDKALKLKVCKNDKVQKQLKNVEKIWKSFDTNLQKVLSKKANKKTYKEIKTENLTLLKEMNNAVSLYVSQSKESVSKRAQAINLSGKERMLTQKISKELLEKNKPQLQKTAKLFEEILTDLQKENKLPKIKSQLNIAQALWQKIEPTLEKSITDKKLLATAISDLDTLRSQMNKAVTLYEKSIKRAKQALKLSSLVNQYMQKKGAQNHTLNLAGKQRMLTQKMTKLSLLISLNIDKKKNIDRLIKADTLYEKTLKGLQLGDPTLNLHENKNREITTYIASLEKEWEPFSKNIQAMATSNKKELKALSYIIQKNEKLLSMSNQLVQLFKQTQTKQTFMDKARANIVDIAGRQRMLTQKMTKEKLLIVVKIAIASNSAKLQKSITLFDSSLQALMLGDEKLKVIKPSNKKISKQLQVVATQWEKLKPLYLKKKLAKKELIAIVKGNPLLLKEMNKAVSLSESVADY